MEKKIDKATSNDIQDYQEESDNMENQELTEEEIAEYQKNKAKLSRTMTFIILIIVLLLGLLIIMNKYFNG